jgi:hypothetical protein
VHGSGAELQQPVRQGPAKHNLGRMLCNYYQIGT